jgi:hypothetical protein
MVVTGGVYAALLSGAGVVTTGGAEGGEEPDGVTGGAGGAGGVVGFKGM